MDHTSETAQGDGCAASLLGRITAWVRMPRVALVMVFTSAHMAREQPKRSAFSGRGRDTRAGP
jgi:hypothetical protein